MALRTVGTTLVVLTLAACSSQPREPAATPAPAAPAASLAPAAAPTAAANAAAPNAQGAVLNRKLISAGYRATTIKGEIYYCRTVDMTNTSFKKRVCLTEPQLREEERKTKEMQDNMLRQEMSPACTPMPACSG
jgi:hypothetical protein